MGIPNKKLFDEVNLGNLKFIKDNEYYIYENQHISDSIWNIKKWIITINNNEIQSKKLEFSLNTTFFINQIQNLLTKTYSKLFNQLHVITQNTNEFWLFCTFKYPNLIQTNIKKLENSLLKINDGLIGFKLSILCENNKLSLYISDRFGLAKIPADLLLYTIKYIYKAFDINDNIEKLLIQNNQVSLFHLTLTPEIILLQLEQKFLYPNYYINKHNNKYLIYKNNLFSIEEQNTTKLNLINTKELINMNIFSVEILESKEINSELYKIDKTILQTNLHIVKKQLLKPLQQKTHNIFITRRLALISMSQHQSKYINLINEALTIEPDNLLWLSYILQATYKNNKNSYELLEKLFHTLVQKIPSISSHITLKNFFTKMFGYIFYKHDYTKAEKYLLTYLKHDKTSIEALYVLQYIYEQIQDSIKQQKILEFLLNQDITSALKALIHKKLFKIKKKDSILKAIEHGLIALQYIHDDSAFILEVIDIMLNTNQEKQAVILIQMILDQSHNIKKNIEHILKCKIASIWIEKFHREDLAIKYLEDIYTEQNDNIHVLNYLEKIYENQNQKTKLIEILKHKFNYELTKNNKNSTQTFIKLFDIYINNKNFKDAFNILCEYSKFNQLNTEILDMILKYENESIDWNLIYQYVINNIKNNDDKIQIILTKICSTKLKNNSLAIKHLNLIQDYNLIDVQTIQELINFMITNKQYDILTNICITHPELISNNKELIKILLNNSHNVAIEQKEKLSLMLYAQDPQEIQKLHEITQYYKNTNEIHKMLLLIDTILATHTSINLKKYWLEYAIEQIISMNYQKIIENKLEQYIQKLVKYSEDYNSTIKKIIEMLNHTPYSKLKILSKYCIDLLQNNILPQINEESYEYLLKDTPKTLTTVYIQLAQQNKNNLEKYKHYLIKALQMYLIYKPQKAGKILNTMLELSKISLIPIQLLTQIKTTNLWQHNPNLYLTILENQINKLDNKSEKINLIKEAANIAANVTNDIKKAESLYKNMLQYTDNIWEIYLELYKLYERNNDFEQSETYLKKALSEIKLLYDKPEEAITVINQLIKKYDQKTYVEQIINKHLLQIAQSSNIDLIYKLTPILIELQIFKEDIYDQLIQYCINIKDIETLTKLFIIYIQNIIHKNDVENLYTKIKNLILNNHQTTEEWVLFLTQISKEIDNINTKKEIKAIMLTNISLDLFENNFHIDKVYELMQEAYILNKQESKIWIPLYMLKKDYVSKNELKQYLEEILPLVIQNKNIIKKYPVTLENLIKELQQFATESTIKVLQSISDNIRQDNIQNETDTDSTQNRLEQKSQISTNSLSTSHSSSKNTVINWKEVILKLEVPPNATTLIFNYPFENILEKHIALQCISLLTGNFDELKQWQWQVWRYPEHYSYPLNAKPRLPNNFMHAKYFSPTFKLIMLTTSFLAKANKDLFSIRNILRKHNYTSKMLKELRIKLEYDDMFFIKTGLTKYQDKIKQQKYIFYHLPNLKKEIYFIPKERTFYFDKLFYGNLPPSIIFHKILAYMLAIDFNYFIYLNLDIQNHVLPQLFYLYEYLTSSILSKLSKSIDPLYLEIKKNISSINKNTFKILYQKADLSIAELNTIKMVMKNHIYKILIAETLDIIGVFESITTTNLLQQNLSLYSILEISPYFKNLLKYATQLKL